MTARRFTCAELGVCQGRPGCSCDWPAPIPRPAALARHPFAPGAEEQPTQRSKDERNVFAAVVACLAAGGVGYSIGSLVMGLFS